MDKYLGLLKDIIQHSHGVRRIGSAAVDLCYVAAGRMDGYFEYNLNSYDVAGGVIILQEAGGKVTDFSGGDDYVFGRELVGSNEKIHKELLGKVKNHW